MGPTYEDYHAAQLSIIHSVLRVGGFLESFLELNMVSFFSTNLVKDHLLLLKKISFVKSIKSTYASKVYNSSILQS